MHFEQVFLILLAVNLRPCHFLSFFGSTTCVGNFVEDVKITLVRRSSFWWWETELGSTRLKKGFFELKNVSRDELIDSVDNLFVRFDYVYDKGDHKRFYITNDLKSTKFKEFALKRLSPTYIHGDSTSTDKVSLGHIKLDEPECTLYRMIRAVLIEYEEETGLLHPAEQLYIVSGTIAAPFTDLPFATTDTIRIPDSALPHVDLDVIRHEFGHTIRHSYDGGFIHLLHDTIKFSYLQEHWCNKKTNEGFAFNEGFADFFTVESCSPLHPDTLGFEYEEKVSDTLKKIAMKCHNTLALGKKAFVLLLKDNQGSIHSFDDFRNAHTARYNSCALDSI